METIKIIIKTIFRAIFYALCTVIAFAIILLILSFITVNDTIGQIILGIGVIATCISVLFAVIKGIKLFKLKHINKLIPLLCNEKDSDKRHEIIDLMENDFSYFKKKDSKAIELINSVHQKFLAEIIFDGTITGDEKEILTYLENKLEINSKFIRRNRREAYMIAYNWAIKDRELTEDEEKVLQNIFMQLEINPADVEKEQNFITELSLARTIVGKDFQPISVPFNLRAGEQCYFSTENTGFYKSKQQNYEVFPNKQAEIQGKLYVTNQRIIIISPGDFERNLTSIDTITNYNDSFIRITFRGKEKPFFLKNPHPYLLRVIITNYINKARI